MQLSTPFHLSSPSCTDSLAFGSEALTSQRHNTTPRLHLLPPQHPSPSRLIKEFCVQDVSVACARVQRGERVCHASLCHRRETNKANNRFSRRYDSCFLKWYSESTIQSRPQSCAVEDANIPLSEFLRGTSKEDECEPLFRQYKSCLTVSPSGSPALHTK